MRQAADWVPVNPAPGEIAPGYFGGVRFNTRPLPRTPRRLPATTMSIVVMQGTAVVTETVVRAPSFSPPEDAELEQFRGVQAHLRRLSQRLEPDPAQRGCWDQFYERYDPLIRRVVRSTLRRGASDADTEDCVQEVWAELVTKLVGLDYDPRRGQLSSWLFTFARRKVIRFIHRKSRHPAQQLTDPAATVADRDGDPSIACGRRENRQLVRHTMARLRTRVSEVNYQVLRLRWIDGRTSAEIAAEVNLTQDQVRYRLRRMKRKFRVLIAPHVAESDSLGP